MAKPQTILRAVREAIKGRRTEAGERNAVAGILARYGYLQVPETLAAGTAERRSVHIYLWREALEKGPEGDLILVTGPTIEGQAHRAQDVGFRAEGGRAIFVESVDWTGKGAVAAEQGMTRAAKRAVGKAASGKAAPRTGRESRKDPKTAREAVEVYGAGEHYYIPSYLKDGERRPLAAYDFVWAHTLKELEHKAKALREKYPYPLTVLKMRLSTTGRILHREHYTDLEPAGRKGGEDAALAAMEAEFTKVAEEAMSRLAQIPAGPTGQRALKAVEELLANTIKGSIGKFEGLLGRKATEEEKQRLFRIRHAVIDPVHKELLVMDYSWRESERERLAAEAAAADAVAADRRRLVAIKGAMRKAADRDWSEESADMIRAEIDRHRAMASEAEEIDHRLSAAGQKEATKLRAVRQEWNAAFGRMERALEEIGMAAARRASEELEAKRAPAPPPDPVADDAAMMAQFSTLLTQALQGLKA